MKTKRILQCLLVCVLLFALARLYFRVTDDFRIANITYEIPFHSEWEIPSLDMASQDKVNTILDQKFSYIGKGAQCYAFGSDDGKYVLKLFKFKHLKPSLFVEYLPAIWPLKNYKEKETARKIRKLESVFVGYRLAYGVHRDETGLLYIQLNPNQGHTKRTVTVRDKIGLERTIDLDSIVFVVQEKAKTTRSVLRESLEKGDVAGAKRRVRQILDLYKLEYSKGIYDLDHGVMHNTGFVGEKPIHLDVGKLTKEERMKSKEYSRSDFAIILAKFDRWISENFPKEYPEMKKDIQEAAQM